MDTNRRTLWECTDDRSGARLVADGDRTILATNLARKLTPADLHALADAARRRACELAGAERGELAASA